MGDFADEVVVYPEISGLVLGDESIRRISEAYGPKRFHDIHDLVQGTDPLVRLLYEQIFEDLIRLDPSSTEVEVRAGSLAESWIWGGRDPHAENVDQFIFATSPSTCVFDRETEAPRHLPSGRWVYVPGNVKHVAPSQGGFRFFSAANVVDTVDPVVFSNVMQRYKRSSVERYVLESMP